MHAERLSLVGAEMAVRIEPNSSVTVFAGAAKQRPFATASMGEVPVNLDHLPALRRGDQAAEPTTTAATQQAPVGAVPDLAALLAWIDGLGAIGLDGHELSGLGLKDGNLTVDDQRNGKNFGRLSGPALDAPGPPVMGWGHLSRTAGEQTASHPRRPPCPKIQPPSALSRAPSSAESSPGPIS